MPTQLINMIQNMYPFGQLQEYDQKNRVLVKQLIFKENNNLNQLLRSAKISKKLSEHKILVKLQTVLQQQDALSLLYQYIPIQVSKYLQTLGQQFIKQYRNQLYALAQILAENRIVTTLEMQNMGLNEKYEAKYFLGMDFVQKKQVNIYELKNDYIQEIKRIFSTYINRQSVLVPKKYTKNLVKLDNRMSDTQQIQNTYIDPQNGLVKTRKHESIYYERTKEHEIKKRKQSYMSSVSNLRINNLYKRINQIQLQVCNTKTNNKNGLKLSIEGRQYTSKSSYDSAKLALQAHKYRNVLSKNHLNLSSNANALMKQPQYENDSQFADQYSQIQQYQKSIRSNKPNRYAVKNLQMSAHQKNLQMSAHHQPSNPKQRPYKKFSTQFPSLGDFQQPLMVLTNALRISANGLDKKQKRVNKKIEMFKQREYSEMKSVSGNNNYMADFMSVLEEDSSTNQKTSKHNQNQLETLSKPPSLKMVSQRQIEDIDCYSPRNPQVSKRKLAPSTYSQHQLPSPSITYPLLHSNPIIQAQACSKVKTKTSIESQASIHSRVKDAIQNSKKLIQKLKQRSKKQA